VGNETAMIPGLLVVFTFMTYQIMGGEFAGEMKKVLRHETFRAALWRSGRSTNSILPSCRERLLLQMVHGQPTFENQKDKSGCLGLPTRQGSLPEHELKDFMPRYHFDLVDSITVADQGGQIIADDLMAADVADRLARELFEIRKELRGKKFYILVTDAEGEEIHRAPIDPSLPIAITEDASN
jgi:hypothetical protein